MEPVKKKIVHAMHYRILVYIRAGTSWIWVQMQCSAVQYISREISDLSGNIAVCEWA